jgi:hypothetical protein
VDRLRSKLAAQGAALSAATAKFEAQLAAVQKDADAAVEGYKDRWRLEHERRRNLHNQVGNVVLQCTMGRTVAA